MKITKIKRKVTGQHYDNIELEAEINAADDIYDVANQLDEMCHNLLDDIQEKRDKKSEDELKKHNLKQKVERFLKIIEGATPEEITKIINEPDLPF